jgi:hypothetical protein
VGPRASLDLLKKRKIFCPTGIATPDCSSYDVLEGIKIAHNGKCGVFVNLKWQILLMLFENGALLYYILVISK